MTVKNHLDLLVECKDLLENFVEQDAEQFEVSYELLDDINNLTWQLLQEIDLKKRNIRPIKIEVK